MLVVHSFWVVMAFSLTLISIAAGETASPPTASSVTTDSSAYCLELSRRIAEREPDPATLAGRLAKDGRGLCQDGHTRSGITLLRRALILRANIQMQPE